MRTVGKISTVCRIEERVVSEALEAASGCAAGLTALSTLSLKAKRIDSCISPILAARAMLAANSALPDIDLQSVW